MENLGKPIYARLDVIASYSPFYPSDRLKSELLKDLRLSSSGSFVARREQFSRKSANFLSIRFDLFAYNNMPRACLQALTCRSQPLKSTHDCVAPARCGIGIARIWAW